MLGYSVLAYKLLENKKRESGLKKSGMDLPQYEFDGLKIRMNGEDTNEGKEEDELEDEV